jgi:hypothetical protein
MTQITINEGHNWKKGEEDVLKISAWLHADEIKNLRPDWTQDQFMDFILGLKEPLQEIIHQTVDQCIAEWASVFLKEVNDD